MRLGRAPRRPQLCGQYPDHKSDERGEANDYRRAPVLHHPNHDPIKNSTNTRDGRYRRSHVLLRSPDSVAAWTHVGPKLKI